MRSFLASILLVCSAAARPIPDIYYWQTDMIYHGWEELFPQIQDKAYNDGSPFAIRKLYDYQLLIANYSTNEINSLTFQHSGQTVEVSGPISPKSILVHPCRLKEIPGPSLRWDVVVRAGDEERRASQEDRLVLTVEQPAIPMLIRISNDSVRIVESKLDDALVTEGLSTKSRTFSSEREKASFDALSRRIPDPLGKLERYAMQATEEERREIDEMPLKRIIEETRWQLSRRGYDPKQPARVYRTLRAARANDSTAIYCLGYFLHDGEICGADPYAAFQCFLESTRDAWGCEWAELMQGYYYETGLFVERNPQEALRHYCNASQLEPIGGHWTYRLAYLLFTRDNPNRLAAIEALLSVIHWDMPTPGIFRALSEQYPHGIPMGR